MHVQPNIDRENENSSGVVYVFEIKHEFLL